MLPIDVTARNYYRILKNPMHGIDEVEAEVNKDTLNGDAMNEAAMPAESKLDSGKAGRPVATRTIESQVQDWYVSLSREAHPGLRQAARNDVRTFVQNAQGDEKVKPRSARYLAPSVRI
jgi:hypothetical protein